MRRTGVLVIALLLSAVGTGRAQAEGEVATPEVDEMPLLGALVRYKPRSGASGDWILGTMTHIEMQQRTCLAVYTHVPDDPAYVVGRADSLELAWRAGAARFPRNLAQLDSMVGGVIWHAVDLEKALEGVPECLPSVE